MMKGTRPLDNDEIRRVSTCFTGTFATRNRGLFMLGVSTGGRISAGLNGKLATHSLRKSFAQRVYEQSGDIYLVQELLGHRSVSTTQKYLGVNYASARQTVEAIALIAERDRTYLLGMSLKKEADETLFLELALRGYDLSKLRDNDTTAEIRKIAV